MHFCFTVSIYCLLLCVIAPATFSHFSLSSHLYNHPFYTTLALAYFSPSTPQPPNFTSHCLTNSSVSQPRNQCNFHRHRIAVTVKRCLTRAIRLGSKYSMWCSLLSLSLYLHSICNATYYQSSQNLYPMHPHFEMPNISTNVVSRFSFIAIEIDRFPTCNRNNVTIRNPSSTPLFLVLVMPQYPKILYCTSNEARNYDLTVVYSKFIIYSAHHVNPQVHFYIMLYKTIHLSPSMIQTQLSNRILHLVRLPPPSHNDGNRD